MLTTLLILFLVTIAVTAGVLLAAHGLALSRAHDGRWALPPALGAGYASGHALIRGWPTIPVPESMDWLIYLALTAGLTGIVIGAVERPWRPACRLVGMVGLATLAVGLLLGRSSLPVVWLAAGVVGWVAAWANVAALAGRLGSGVAPPLILVAAGSAVVLAFSGTVILAALEGVAAVAVASAWAVGRFERGLIWDRGAVGVAVMVVAGLLTVGLVYGEVPIVSVLLLAVAPAAAWVDRLAFISKLDWRWRGLIRALAVGSVVGAAIVVAARVSPDGPY